eukprot:1846654-Rhodomonas_salina.1
MDVRRQPGTVGGDATCSCCGVARAFLTASATFFSRLLLTVSDALATWYPHTPILLVERACTSAQSSLHSNRVVGTLRGIHIILAVHSHTHQRHIIDSRAGGQCYAQHIPTSYGPFIGTLSLFNNACLRQNNDMLRSYLEPVRQSQVAALQPAEDPQLEPHVSNRRHLVVQTMSKVSMSLSEHCEEQAFHVSARSNGR